MLNDRKRLFLNSILIGTVLILSIVISVLITSCLTVVCAFLGVSLLSDSWLLLLVNSIVTFFAYFLCFLILKAIDKRKIHEIASLNSPTDSSVQGILFILGCAMVGNFFTFVLNDIITKLTGFQAVQPEVLEESVSTPSELIFRLFTMALLPALLEEFAFRGMLLGVLRKYGNWSAILISSIIFALGHGNFVQIPFALVFGLAAGMVVIITDSLWPAIIAHFINNALSIVSSYNTSEQMLTYMGYLVIFFVFGAVISAVYFAIKGKIKKLNIKGSLSVGKALIFSFVSPTVIIYVLFQLYRALLSRA